MTTTTPGFSTKISHLRAETTSDEQVPVLVLDVTEEEADKLLLTLDPLAAMAETDAERIKSLRETVRTDDGGGADKRYDQKEFVIGSQ